MWFGAVLHGDGALRTQGVPPSITLPSLGGRWKVPLFVLHFKKTDLFIWLY